MRVDAARDPPEPSERVIEPRLDDPFRITIKNRCSRKIDIQSPIWNLGMEITAFSFKLQANVPEGTKAISYQSVTKYVSSWLYGGAQQQSRRRRSVAVIWCQALGGIRMASPGLTGRITPSISMVPAPSRMK